MSLPRSILCLCVFFIGWTLSLPASHAALPGRVETVDVVRLAQWDRTMVDGGGPSLDVAASAEGRFGFGPPSCGEDGFAYRAIMHPKSGLTLDVPPLARHLELILRPAFGERELSVSVAGVRRLTTQLSGGWQRVVVPLAKTPPGDALLELRLSTASSPLPEAQGIPTETRALLHRVAFDTRRQASRASTRVQSPRSSSDILWLEPGQEVRMPAPLQAGQALETAGTVVQGPGGNMRLHVDLISAYGAIEKITSMPAAMDLPWNIDLSRRGERTPVWLRIRCTGDGDGAAGLLMPRLTRPAVVADRMPRDNQAKTVVLIAVPGLRYEDAGISTGKKPLGLSHQGAWSPSPDLKPALTSLATATSPLTHGVVGLRDEIPKAALGWAQTVRIAGVQTILRAGFVPMTAGSPVWEGFEDVLFADLRRLKPHAKAILESTLEAVLYSTGPTLALAVLSDVTPPYLPTSDAWKAYDRGKAPPPWPANESRKAVAEVTMGQRPFDTRTEAYLQALRRGKAHEALEQVHDFQRALIEKRPDAIVLVVGLGGQLPGEQGTFEPEDVHVPLWIDAPGPRRTAEASGVKKAKRTRADTESSLWFVPDEATLSVTDVAVTAIRAVGAQPPPKAQGSNLFDMLPVSWPTAAFATQTQATTQDLAVWGRTVVMARRGKTGKARFFQPNGFGWKHQPKPEAQEKPAIGATTAQLRGWLSASDRWQPEDFEAAVRIGGKDGYDDPCPR